MSWKTKVRKSFKNLIPFVGLIIIFIAGVILNGETFYDPFNQLNVLGRISIIALPAIGMTLVILLAGIDLSVGSLVSFASVITAMLLMERSWMRATSIVIPALAIFIFIIVYKIVSSSNIFKNKNSKYYAVTLAVLFSSLTLFITVNQVTSGFGTIMVLIVVPIVGMFLGALNGAVIAKGKIQPFIVTLGMMSAAVGLAKFVAGKGGQIHAIYYKAVDSSLDVSSNFAPPSFDLLTSKISIMGFKILPVSVIFFIMVALLVHLILTRFKIGRHIYAIGGNEETARLSGINVDMIKVIVYSFASGLSALAGVFYCSAYTQGKSDAGLTWELDAITAVVIGGTSLMGGKGSVIGTAAGVLIIGYLNNILNLQEVPSEVQDILKGLIIVTAVLLQKGSFIRSIIKLKKSESTLGK